MLAVVSVHIKRHAYNRTSHFATVPSREELQTLAQGLEHAGKASYLNKFLQGSKFLFG